MAVNEIEKLFYQDVFLKKKIGRGSFNKTGHGVKHGIKGGIKTEYDFLTAKEKRNLNSKVEIFNMFQSLQHIDDFKLKSKDQQKLVMENWRKTYKNKEIVKALEISDKGYYNLLKDLGIEVGTNGPNKRVIKAEPVEGIPTLEEFEALPDKDQREILIALRKEFKTEQIKQAWGKSTGGFYNIINRLDIPTSGPNSVDRSKIPEDFDLAAQIKSDKVLPYRIFKHLPQEQQAELFDEYRNRYDKYETLAEEWGTSTGTVYGVSSKLKKVEYTPTVNKDNLEPIRIKAIPSSENKEKKFIAIEPQQHVLDIEEKEVKEEKIPDSQRLRFGTPINEVKERAADEKMNKLVDDSKEDLVKQMDELNKLVLTFAKSTQEKFEDVNKRLEENELQANQIVEAPRMASNEENVEVVTPTTTNGMTLQYENEKEGFLLHQDIKSFISMLEKNPNSFKVSINIEMNE